MRVGAPLILMAEDDPDDRLLAKDAFAQNSRLVDLCFVGDGVELLAYLRRQGPRARRGPTSCCWT